MNVSTQQKPKERIVTTAAKLFYENDIHSIGVDRVSLEAHVSKRTLYKHFANKETLVAYCLDRQSSLWLDEYTQPNNLTPEQKILSVFTTLQERTKTADFKGCPFMNASIELRGSKESAYDVARLAKDKLFHFFETQTKAIHLAEPATVAEALVVLFDGTNSWFMLHGSFPKSTLKQVHTLLSKDMNKKY